MKKMDVPKNVHSLDDLAGVVGFEPTNVGFRIRCLNRTWRYPSTSGAVGETRTLMALTTATSTLRVYQFRHDREMLTVRCLRSIRRVTPLIDLAGVVGFEPTNVGFRIRCLNRTWRYPSTSGAVGETRTLMALTTATSTLRVYQFRHDRETFSACIWCCAPDASSLLSLTAHPTERLAGVVGFEPTNVGFRIRCLNRTWRYPSTSGAVGETRTLMALTTATSTLRVYQFRHDRGPNCSPLMCIRRSEVTSRGGVFYLGISFVGALLGFSLPDIPYSWDAGCSTVDKTPPAG